MAKLENMKILEPTRVEYNGAIYVKKNEEAKKGDLVRVINADVIDGVTQGGFYEIFNQFPVDEPAFVDDEGDIRSYEDKKYALETFRKVSETKASADLAERLAELERRLEALEERMKPTTMSQARRLTVGDYARVVANDTMHSANIGDIVKIVEDEHDDQPYRCEDLNGEDVGWFAEHELELVTDEEARWAKIGRKPGEFKKGDIVRVLKDNPHGSEKRKGDIGEITYYDTNESFCVGEGAGWMGYEDVELIVPVEQRFDFAGVEGACQ